MPTSRHHALASAALALALGGAIAAPFGPFAAPASGQSLGHRINTVRQRHAEREAQRREVPPEIKILQKLLYEDVTLAFRETPARDVFDYFRTALGVNLIGRYLDDRTGFGIDPDLPVTIEIEKIRAVDALELVLEACSMPGDECTWQLRKGVLEVGTKERLGEPSAQVVRVYPIGDLLYQPERYDGAIELGLDQYYYGACGPGGGGDSYYPGRYAPHRYYGGGGPSSGSFGGPRVAKDSRPNSAQKKNERAENLVELIVTTIEPVAWERNGGDWASIEHREGALVVRAPDFIQRQIGGYGRVPKPKPARPAAEGAPGTGAESP